MRSEPPRAEWRLQRKLAEKEAGRQRVTLLFRKGRISIEEADTQLDEILAEIKELKGGLDALRTHNQLRADHAAQVEQARRLMDDVRDGLDLIEATNDFERTWALVQAIFVKMLIDTKEPGGKRRKPVQDWYPQFRVICPPEN